MDQADPYGFIAGQHFNEVLKRYGAPVIILNLVKVHSVQGNLLLSCTDTSLLNRESGCELSSGVCVAGCILVGRDFHLG